MSHDDQFHRLLGTLYAAPTNSALWPEFMHQLGPVLGVGKASLISHDLTREDHRILASLGDTVQQSIPLYEDHYCHHDEWTQRFPRGARAGRIIQGSELWPDDAMYRSVYYNDFLKPFDVCEMACLLAVHSKDAFECISIYRGPSEESFGPEQLSILSMLAPHLRTALYTRRKLRDLESRVSELEDAINNLTAALILVDATGRCVLVNKAAKRILDKRDGLLLNRSALGAANPAEMHRLRAIIAGAIATSQRRAYHGNGAAQISRRSQSPLQIVAAPFRSETPLLPSHAAAIVFIHDPEANLSMPSEVLRMLFGLRPVEIRLAMTLMNGRSLPEAAELHGVSHETVRTQIKSIFQKTNTRSQSELVRLISKLDAVETGPQ